MFYEAAAKMRREVEADLGFDGVRDRIVLLGDAGKSIVSGSAFICPAAACRIGTAPWMRGAPGPAWSPGRQEKIFMDYAAWARRSRPVATLLTLWLHNESDTYYHHISAAEWAGALRHDARLTRSALHMDAGHTPYMFVWVPAAFGPASARGAAIIGAAQAIKSGMRMLEDDPEFHALAGPQTGDLDMSNQAPGYGYMHMTRQDAVSLVHRAANCAANALRTYAHAGSAAAAHVLDCQGPVAARARCDGTDPDRVDVALSLAPATSIGALGTAAASGAGWQAVAPGGHQTLAARSAELVSASAVRLRFPKPVGRGWRLYYGYGVGRIALDGGAGQGSALYDSAGIPMTLPPSGLAVERAAGRATSGRSSVIPSGLE